MNRKILSFFLLFLSVFTIFLTNKAKAITSGPDGLSLAPAYQQVSLQPGEAKTTVKFIITNNTRDPKTLNLSINDFNTLNESGGLFFVGTNPTQLQQRYGLAKWANIPQNQITVAANKNATVNVEILNNVSLQPGGHYGALMVAINQNGSSSNKNNVNVKPVASALMFVTKLGGDTHNLDLKSVTAHHSIFSLPHTVDLKFYNAGNTHLTPRGVVTVTSPGGQPVAKGIINENSNLILPASTRIYTVNLQNLGSAIWPGRYKLKAEIRFDGLDQPRFYQSSIFIIPVFSQVVIILIVITLFIIFRFRKLRKKSQNPHSKSS